MNKNETVFIADRVTYMRLIAAARYGPGAGFPRRKKAEQAMGQKAYKITFEVPNSDNILDSDEQREVISPEEK